MEPLWSPVVATGGNLSQIARPRKRLNQAKTVAAGCGQLPFEAHGKEGVDGSSPSEGLKPLQNDLFCCLFRRDREDEYGEGRVNGHLQGLFASIRRPPPVEGTLTEHGRPAR
jgi:hypothetical protein